MEEQESEKKGQLKALFIEAKGTGQKYIGVMIQTEGDSEPEVIINRKRISMQNSTITWRV